MNENIKLAREVRRELTSGILPFWINNVVDPENGGFYGQITGEGNVVKDAPKGGILNARILWTFSSAYRVLKDPEYLRMATYAKNYVMNHFIDHKYGGTYWELNADGTPSNTRKQIYSIAFTIYALTEYYRITEDHIVLVEAIKLFELIEKHSFDNKKNGYFEAYDREWNLLDDLRLSPKDANDPKTMNTHLHILEAYTNLYRVYKNELLRKQLHNLIRLYVDKVVNNKTSHLELFFDENWNCKSTLTSYGHDIEASWLIYEAAEVLGDKELIDEVRNVSIKIADVAAEGILEDGSIINELNYATGHLDDSRDWWPQAEAIVGYWNAYQLTSDNKYKMMALNNWNFTKQNIVDGESGEWVWSVSRDGKIDRLNDKVGFWKCPYHNSRMCLEIIERIY